jgi:uroporphyrinogen decarboxylase
MNKRERLVAAIRGDDVDRIPVALWRHFPGDDQDPAALAASTVAFQRQYDFDFVKVTPASSFCLRDWGLEDRWVGNQEGTRDLIDYPVRVPADWCRIDPLDPRRGALGAQLRCLELIRNAAGEDVPIVQTIFNGLSQAKNLAGKAHLVSHLRENPEALLEGLESITVTTEQFILEARQRGISGIFLAVQHASYTVLTEAEYAEFGIRFDKRLLEAAEGLWLNILHLHGTRVMFDLLADYPAQVVNWHDRETPPTLKDGQSRVKGAVLGGLRQWETMLRGSPQDVQREAREAIEETAGRRFILGTGCVTPITAPWENIRAAWQAVC